MTASDRRTVASVAELLAALADETATHIVVAGQLVDVPAFRLPPGRRLSGEAAGAALRFAAGGDGVELTADNALADLAIVCDPDRRAVHNDLTQARLGRLELETLDVTGAVRIVVDGEVRSGHVAARSVHVEAADVRGVGERPKGFGVEVVAGAFTVWNRQADADVIITADIDQVSAGVAGAPVRGGGVFLSGAGETGGQLIVSRLAAGAIFSDGGIARGTPDRICCGVFVGQGAVADEVVNRGPVTTYGANDMVLDNWGQVDRWRAMEKITSLGPSGIGFVNFGALGDLELAAPIETFGKGARGFNVYDGQLRRAVFERIVTHGDGAVGLQVSRPVGEITVRQGVETFGGTGESLVKGVQTTLSAIAFSVKPGGSIERVEIAGGVRTHGPGVDALELHGRIGALSIAGAAEPAGGGFAGI
jgi:hypothetical protein